MARKGQAARGDDLTGRIAYVDRWPASSTQTVPCPSTRLDLGWTTGWIANHPGYVAAKADRAPRQHPFCISFNQVPAISVGWRVVRDRSTSCRNIKSFRQGERAMTITSDPSFWQLRACSIDWRLPLIISSTVRIVLCYSDSWINYGYTKNAPKDGFP